MSEFSRRHFLHAVGATGLSLLGAHALAGCDDPSGSPNDASGGRGPSPDAASNGGPGDAARSRDASAPQVDAGLPDAGDLGPPDGAIDATAPHDAGDAADAVPGARWWLEGNFAPVPDEIDAEDLEVIGALPPELDGLYLRNGPNPHTGESPHWLMGDGMVHGVRLERGRARWYRNRFLQTAHVTRREGDPPLNPVDPANTKANTGLVWHGDRLLALYEAGAPFEITRDLDNVGLQDYGGALHRPIAAHPKIDPVTGEMFMLSYSAFAPFCTLHRVSPDGRAVASTDVDIAGPSMMHELLITERFLVVLDLPILFDSALIFTKPIPYRWDDEYGARIGLIPRAGGDAQWFEIDPCYIFHAYNAYEREGEVVIDAIRHAPMWAGDNLELQGEMWMQRYTLRPGTGEVHEARTDDRAVEFPIVAPAVQGRPHRFGYALQYEPASGDAPLGAIRHLVKYDFRDLSTRTHDFGPDLQPDEPSFAPAPGAADAETDGFLLGYAYNRATERSELYVLDATNVSAPAIARVLLPRRVPYGFHGLWIA